MARSGTGGKTESATQSFVARCSEAVQLVVDEMDFPSVAGYRRIAIRVECDFHPPRRCGNFPLAGRTILLCRAGWGVELGQASSHRRVSGAHGGLALGDIEWRGDDSRVWGEGAISGIRDGWEERQSSSLRRR